MRRTGLMLALVVCSIAVVCAIAVSAASARTWIIKPDGTGDSPTIAAGLDSALAGDTVQVMCGTYYEHDITMKSGVCLTSETGLADCVTIDAEDLGRALYSDMADSTTCIVGITMTNGRVSGTGEGGGMYASHSHLRVTRCAFTGNFAGLRGGGVAIYNSRAVFTDCAFVGNVKGAQDECCYPGGGVYASGGFPKFFGCTFTANVAAQGPGGGFASEGSCSPTFEGCLFERNNEGGGAHFSGWGTRATVAGCVFRDNVGRGLFSSIDARIIECLFEGNTTLGSGAGIACNYADLTVTDCVFKHDTCSADGGAIYLYKASSAVTGCQFIENKAKTRGGAIAASDSSLPYIDQCLFARNHAKQNGGAVLARGNSQITLESCTLSGGIALTNGAGVSCTGASSAALHNCIIAFSADGEAVHWDGMGAEPWLTCSDLYGNEGGDWTGAIADQFGVSGNISEDPLFCDADADDYTIWDTSPCATANSPAGCGLIGVYDVGCSLAGVGGGRGSGLAGLRLDPIMPNPVRGVADIAYSIPGGPAASRVILAIFDVQGRRVRVLVSGDVAAGDHIATWDRRDDRGELTVPGVYFCLLRWNAETRTQPMILSE